MSVPAGGVLSVLAEQWLPELWEFHSRDAGGGEAARPCIEDCQSSGCQGQSRVAARETLSVMFDAPSAVRQCASGKSVPHHQLGP